MKKMILVLAAAMVLLTGCTANHAAEANFTEISDGRAAQLMAMGTTAAVLDVRTAPAYEAQHIAGARCIPYELISAGSARSALPDMDQLILVYGTDECHSRSAAQKLASLGYTNVHAFSGFETWRGQVEHGIRIPHIG